MSIFDCPGAFTPFFTESVIAKTTRGDTAFRASVLLNARDSAIMGTHYGDVYSIVLPVAEWGLVTQPRRGDVFEFDGKRLYVHACHEVDSCYHVQALSRNVR
jgi:hypothetical protein